MPNGAACCVRPARGSSLIARNAVSLGALLIWQMALNWQYALGDYEGTPDLLFRIGSGFAAIRENAAKLPRATLEVNLTKEHFPNEDERQLLALIGEEVGHTKIQLKANRLGNQGISAFRQCIEAERSIGQKRLIQRPKNAGGASEIESLFHVLGSQNSRKVQLDYAKQG